MSRSSAVLGVLAVAALAACTHEAPSERPAPAASSSASAASSSAPAASSSAPAASSSVPDDARWLVQGTPDERFARAAAHFRGFDVAMVETGYRYGELHWAGRDRNWGYAEYQLAKIETAIARGVERRPRRAASAHMIEGPIAGVRRAIVSKDGAAFDAAFVGLTASCNACHAAERVGFVHVVPPAVRASVVAGAGGAAP